MKLLSVVGARPNFMKVAAVVEAVNRKNLTAGAEPIEHVLVHTGQHYDAAMSDLFFNDLELPEPNIFLGVGSGSHSVQTARIMERFETVLLQERPDVVLVVGDVNSTLACALVTKKVICAGDQNRAPFIPKLAHVEAGLRSFDRSMPEEINRVVTDALADFLFTTEESANRNLQSEGIPAAKVFFVGNVMIDTLLRYRRKTGQSTILADLQLLDERGAARPYAVLTLHRPANVDDGDAFRRILEALLEITRHVPIVFPAHPRTIKMIEQWDLGDYFVDHFLNGPEPWDARIRIRLSPPLGYLDFVHLMSHARLVLTDSGGIQEESTILGVPCITLRENTERPVTVECGTNILAGSDPQRILEAFHRILRQETKVNIAPKYWDGKAAERIVEILVSQLSRGAENGKRASHPAPERGASAGLALASNPED
ncbi:MAG TPA: UDP-N-acetylglucosamine 2-epimerase (non-hydrolyzing) [Candidatus Acidoferrales bacterium]|nr:UDP-N-acetylglucosamine 2-epimerase (non-hydrolyzing) [Candidatus Acidoferrales bacterium]